MPNIAALATADPPEQANLRLLRLFAFGTFEQYLNNKNDFPEVITPILNF